MSSAIPESRAEADESALMFRRGTHRTALGSSPDAIEEARQSIVALYFDVLERLRALPEPAAAVVDLPGKRYFPATDFAAGVVSTCDFSKARSEAVGRAVVRALRAPRKPEARARQVVLEVLREGCGVEYSESSIQKLVRKYAD